MGQGAPAPEAPAQANPLVQALMGGGAAPQAAPAPMGGGTPAPAPMAGGGAPMAPQGGNAAIIEQLMRSPDPQSQRMGMMLVEREMAQQQQAQEREREMAAAVAAGIDPALLGNSAIASAAASERFRAPDAEIQRFEYGQQNPDFFARQDARAAAGATRINVGPQGIDYGSPPTNHAWARNPDGTVQTDERGAPIALPVGPALAEIEASQAARGRQETLTSRQLNPTIDDISTARDLASSRVLGFIPTTGMFASMAKFVPGAGQRAIDLEATIDAIGSGISLENLNQMRQASPTGGALGPVSDKQSGLLAEAFGSLRQSQSEPLFLYNLARVENTLNNIVHGEGNGPARHDMQAMRNRLRREMGISVPDDGAPAQAATTPVAPGNYRWNPETNRLEPM
jgi:hypothetical protein